MRDFKLATGILFAFKIKISFKLGQVRALKNVILIREALVGLFGLLLLFLWSQGKARLAIVSDAD